jgi:RNA polymerase sigma-70 factor (ECF subfamily)
LPSKSDPSDEELMTAHIAGERAAFRLLFERYAAALTRLMARDIRSPEEVKDLVQQTFLQLHRARQDYDSRKPLRPWLNTIALNLKRQFFREQKRQPAHAFDSDALDELAVSSPHDAVQTEACRQLRRALSCLPSEQREVIELHWFDGLSFSEIGSCVGITSNAAKVRAHRGYCGLRKALTANETSNQGILPRILTNRNVHGLP